jgi:hypothetical protein
MVNGTLTAGAGRADEQGAATMSSAKRDELPLRPVGLALAAVVAGLGAGKATGAEAPLRAPLEPGNQEKMFFIDPTNHPGFEEDPDLVVGPSEPVAPLGGSRPA